MSLIYMPPHFTVADRATQLAVMREHPFATLVTVADGAPAFTHAPLVLQERGDTLALLGHLAIANPHWKTWGDAQRITAVFHGPNGYISPRWYTVREAVPTWNYIAVHAQGRLQTIHDSEGKERVLKALIDAHDRGYRAQWDDIGEDYREKMKRGIVAFEIAVDRVDGKFKLSQNRVPQDKANVLAAMEQGGAGEQGLADWMKRLGIGGA